jgi:hypothetical protein
VSSGWVPGFGGLAAAGISARFIWTMYGRINSKIGLPFSENVVKSIATGIATNLAAGPPPSRPLARLGDRLGDTDALLDRSTPKIGEPTIFYLKVSRLVV